MNTVDAITSADMAITDTDDWYFDPELQQFRQALVEAYDDYREVNGVQVPFLVRSSTGAPYDMVTRAFLQIRPGVPVSDSLLRPPR